VVPGRGGGLLAKNRPVATAVEIAGRTWWWWPGESLRTRPAGPDRAKVAAWAAAGFDIAYRPRNFPNLQGVGEDFPPEARYLVHAGLQAPGHPNALDATVAASQDRLTALIEGTAQDGLVAWRGRCPPCGCCRSTRTTRTSGCARRPDREVPAGRERAPRPAPLPAPYTEEQLGDMVENTEALVGAAHCAGTRRLRRGAARAPGRRLPARPLGCAPLAGVGVIAGLALLATAFPPPGARRWRRPSSRLGLLAAGFSWAALALIAALVFPVLGFALLPWRPWSLLGATGLEPGGRGPVGRRRQRPRRHAGPRAVRRRRRHAGRPARPLAASSCCGSGAAAAWVRAVWAHHRGSARSRWRCSSSPRSASSSSAAATSP
jgi:hypothetical protein